MKTKALTPKGRTQLKFDVWPEQHQALKQLAREQGVSMTALFTRLLEEEIRRQESRQKAA